MEGNVPAYKDLWAIWAGWGGASRGPQGGRLGPGEGPALGFPGVGEVETTERVSRT